MVNAYTMKQNRQIKGDAWMMLSGNWGPAIGVVLLARIIMGAAQMVVSIVMRLFSLFTVIPINMVSNGVTDIMAIPFIVIFFLLGMVVSLSLSMLIMAFEGVLNNGKASYFLQLSRTGHTVEFSTMFDGFSDFIRSALAGLLYGLYVWLWSLLLIVPGIVFSIAYSQVFFILRDHPGLKAPEALRRSRAMMKGAKAKYFWLMLSFIGWFLLTLISFGIAAIWMGPYVWAARTKFYDELKANQEDNMTEAIA